MGTTEWCFLCEQCLGLSWLHSSGRSWHRPCASSVAPEPRHTAGVQLSSLRYLVDWAAPYTTTLLWTYFLVASTAAYASQCHKLEPDTEQQTGSKLGKMYVKAVYCYPTYLTYMHSTSCETLGWMKHKLESRLSGEISITSDTQMTPLYGRKWIRTKEPLDESERGEWKSWLKAQHSEN